MILVRIVSGPRAGQKNQVPLQPKDLIQLSRNGWRWEVDWHTVPDSVALRWGISDMTNKIMSALIRGAVVQFLDHVWQVDTCKDITEKLVGEIEDTIVYGGYNMLVECDDEDKLVIGTHSTEYPVQ